jgi:hypothetical protein
MPLQGVFSLFVTIHRALPYALALALSGRFLVFFFNIVTIITDFMLLLMPL